MPAFLLVRVERKCYYYNVDDYEMLPYKKTYGCITIMK